MSLGSTGRDRITGFKGVITGHCTYISGCSQFLLVPPFNGEKPIESQWFDEQRIELLADVPVIALDNGSTPGCDKAAPKR